MSVSERHPPDHAARSSGVDDGAPDLRLGRRAIELLRAARDMGDPSLIVQAEALALTAGLALARHLRDEGRTGAEA